MSHQPTLRPVLGPLALTTLGIGSVIGTGIFVLTGTAASQHAGPALVVSMIIAATACALAGLCYAELAAMIPIAGSAYTYAHASAGQFVAWIIGWDLVLEYALSASTIAVGWSGYFVSFMRDLGLHLPPALTAAPGENAVSAAGALVPGVFNLPATVIVLLVAALLLVGISQSARANTVLVVVKVAVLLLFIALGAAYVRRENLTPFIPANTGTFGEFGWSGVMRGAAIMFFAYIGFDAVSTAAQEARNPQRDMPIGILTSLAICTVIYIAVAVVLIGIVPYNRLNVADPIAVGIDATGLTWFSPVVKISALFGLFSTMLVQLLGQSRIFYSMSRDGLLPEIFGKVHPRFRTPHLSTVMTGGVVAVAAGLLPLGTLSQLVSIGSLLAFTLVCLGVIILRRTRPDLPRPFRVPGVPYVPVLGALVCLVQMASLPWATWERLLVWLGLGLAIYFVYSRPRAREKLGEVAAAGGAGAGAGAAQGDIS
jgi:basic amino acid/polyamine antiporter, APA family